MRWMLGDCRVVGGMRAAHLSAPFSRAQVVLASSSHANARLVVHRYPAADSVEGEQVSEDEWSALVETEEALLLRDEVVPALPHLVLWLLRSGFPRRDNAVEELRNRERMIAREEWQGDVFVVIVDESRAGAILEQWSREACDRAWSLAQAGDWKQAASFADLAWLIDSRPDSRRVALYALTLEKTSGFSAAEDVLALEANSRRKEDIEAIRSLITSYRAQLASEPAEIVRLFPRLSDQIPAIQKWKTDSRLENGMFFGSSLSLGGTPD